MTEEPGLDNPAYVSSVEEGELVTNSSDSGRSNRTRGESDGRVSGNGLSVFPGIVLCRILVVESSRNVFFFFFLRGNGSGSFGCHSMSSSPKGNETLSDHVI